MRIIQSFWTLPMIKSRETVSNNRFSGGWLDLKYHLMSWTYSCLQLKHYYDRVELITDRAGRTLLIDELQLPYSRVDIVLDRLNDYDPEWWAIGKILAFSMQDTPFIHVDGDVFIWERFPERIEKGRLVAQNLEQGFPFYRAVMDALLADNAYIPRVITDGYAHNDSLHAFNAGIIGGNDISFFRDFANEAFLFIRRNHAGLQHMPSGMINAFYEQHLYYCMAKNRKIPVECYSDIIDQDLLNLRLKSLWQFQHAPVSTGYIHLFGEDAKKNFDICEELSGKLQSDYPRYYDRVMDIVGKTEENKIKI